MMTQLSQSLVTILFKLIMLNTKLFSMFLEWDQIFPLFTRLLTPIKRQIFGQINGLLKTSMATSKFLPLDTMMNPNVCTSYESLQS
jgi:hypothetical protein